MKVAICLSFCYKCRMFKSKNPDIKVIELKNSIKGLGDLISILTYWLHIPHCSNCENRRVLLNEYFPLRWLIPVKYRYPKDNIEIRELLNLMEVKKFPLVLDKTTWTVEYPF